MTPTAYSADFHRRVALALSPLLNEIITYVAATPSDTLAPQNQAALKSQVDYWTGQTPNPTTAGTPAWLQKQQQRHGD
jgi:hypothetical protein